MGRLRGVGGEGSGLFLGFLLSPSLQGRGKGTSLNGASLAPNPVASSIYVRAPEAPALTNGRYQLRLISPPQAVREHDHPDVLPDRPRWAAFDLPAVVVERVARGVPAGGSRDAVPTWCRNEAGIRRSRSPGAS